jgi:hypothetical protein
MRGFSLSMRLNSHPPRTASLFTFRYMQRKTAKPLTTKQAKEGRRRKNPSSGTLFKRRKEERKEERRRKNPSSVTLFLRTLTNQGLDQTPSPGGQESPWFSSCRGMSFHVLSQFLCSVLVLRLELLCPCSIRRRPHQCRLCNCSPIGNNPPLDSCSNY